jgi:hypothetical protein
LRESAFGAKMSARIGAMREHQTRHACNA